MSVAKQSQITIISFSFNIEYENLVYEEGPCVIFSTLLTMNVVGLKIFVSLQLISQKDISFKFTNNNNNNINNKAAFFNFDVKCTAAVVVVGMAIHFFIFFYHGDFMITYVCLKISKSISFY